MQNVSGILSKINDTQHKLVTMNGEMLIEGALSYSEGFHSDIDLSNLDIRPLETSQLVVSRSFKKMRLKSSVTNSVGVDDCDCGGLDCDECSDCDCETDCAWSSDPDDCSTPNDCDCNDCL